MTSFPTAPKQPKEITQHGLTLRARCHEFCLGQGRLVHLFEPRRHGNTEKNNEKLRDSVSPW